MHVKTLTTPNIARTSWLLTILDRGERISCASLAHSANAASLRLDAVLPELRRRTEGRESRACAYTASSSARKRIDGT